MCLQLVAELTDGTVPMNGEGFQVGIGQSLLVRVWFNVDSFAIEQRIFCICKRGFAELVRIDTATAQAETIHRWVHCNSS